MRRLAGGAGPRALPTTTAAAVVDHPVRLGAGAEADVIVTDAVGAPAHVLATVLDHARALDLGVTAAALAATEATALVATAAAVLAVIAAAALAVRNGQLARQACHQGQRLENAQLRHDGSPSTSRTAWVARSAAAASCCRSRLKIR